MTVIGGFTIGNNLPATRFRERHEGLPSRELRYPGKITL
jgi:hypothetical protein